MATGSKSARMTWADGLAFLISAMRRIGPGRARAARKSRGGGIAAAELFELFKRLLLPSSRHFTTF